MYVLRKQVPRRSFFWKSALVPFIMPVDVEAAGIDVHLAARSGDAQVVRSLVQRPGTDMEARDILGDTALLKAARYGHTEVLREQPASK